ncbi:MAG: hypothetical protein M3Y81_22045, partial [Chloroflexota bacterium]|nr:hypothetical protein [Chloroflexota bacterium]
TPLFCFNCGVASRPQARFCFACGHPLQAADALLSSTEKLPSVSRNTLSTSVVSPFTLPAFSTVSKQISMIYSGHSGEVMAVTWSPDSQKIASASSDGSIHVWHVQDGKPLFMYREHRDLVFAVAWSPGGKALVSAGSDGTAQVWDAQTGQRISIFRGHMGAVYAVAWSPDGKIIVTGGADRTVQVWNAVNGKLIFTYSRRAFPRLTGWGHTGRVRTVGWSSDGKHIASGGEDKTVQVWNWQEGKQVSTFHHHTGIVRAPAWSPSGSFLASAGNGLVWAWDALSGVTPTTGQRRHRSARTLAWSPDGKHIVVAGKSRVVRVWNSMNDAQVSKYIGHEAGVCAVAWSPDGKYIASGSSDKTIHVWEPVKA